MLTVEISAQEFYDEEKSMFLTTKGGILNLEHSLVSLSKWESKWCKPFLGTVEKTNDETIDYIRCMTITKNVDPLLYQSLTTDIVRRISEYIDAPMTATWFSKNNEPRNSEVITAEIIYYSMIALNIPFECQKWHLNRLLTLIKVCNVKNKPPQKSSRKELASRNAALNAMRRKQLNTKG